jgi:hypothetical protein
MMADGFYREKEKKWNGLYGSHVQQLSLHRSVMELACTELVARDLIHCEYCGKRAIISHTFSVLL